MPKSFRKMARKAGMPPGSLIYTGEQEPLTARITLTRYDGEDYTATELDSLDACPMADDQPGVIWININGVNQVRNLEKLGACFHLHPLVLEDILEVDQRPKIEDYEDYLYIILRTIRSGSAAADIESEQVSLILGPRYVITCHEGNGDLFAPIRERLATAKGKLRKMGADYLAYSLIDLVVDNYFVELEVFSDRVENLEDEVVERSSPNTLREVHRFKNDMIMLRKSLWPLREVIARLERREFPLISDSLTIYFKDVYDHTIIAIDTVETYRDIISGMLDIYLYSVNNRLSEIMKVLTVITTIFMPMNFITSLYGMNFKHMPELEWQYGYFGVLAMIGLIAISMFIFIKKRHWI